MGMSAPPVAVTGSAATAEPRGDQADDQAKESRLTHRPGRDMLGPQSEHDRLVKPICLQ